MEFLLVLRWYLYRLALWLRSHLAGLHQGPLYRRSKNATVLYAAWNTRHKPDWVRREVLRLKTLMPASGCSKIAATFCYLHADRGETISKSFVAKLLKAEGEAVIGCGRR